ncbi:PilZ domain-containing protein [Singulisphaera rosea]
MSHEFDRPNFKNIGDRSVRFDPPPCAEGEPSPESLGLLDLFRAWIRQSPQDRRSMPRHPAHDMEIWVGWKRKEEAFFASPARLVNISRGGALVSVTEPPPQGEMAWLYLGESDPTDCLQANVLEIKRTREGGSFARLAFGEPCPHKFFEAAVCKLPPLKAREVVRPRPTENET